MESMIVTHVSVCFEINPAVTLSAEKLGAKAEAWMDQLMCLEEADDMLSDVEMSGDVAEREITIEMIVLTADPLEANIKAMTAIRAALHAAGDGTAGWPDANMIAKALESAQVKTEKASLVPA